MEDWQIPIETNDASWRERCNEKMETLKNKQFSSSGSPSQLLQGKPSVEKKFMSVELYQSVQNKDADIFVDQLEKTVEEGRLCLSDVFGLVTCAGDSLLHVAAHFGADDIAELICIHFPELITIRNIKGNTALHVAARAKNSNVIKLILAARAKNSNVIKLILSHYAAEKAKSQDEGNAVNSLENEDNALTRIANESGDTPLHEAVYSEINFGAVYLLFRADEAVAHHLNNSGKSPLYMAVQASHHLNNSGKSPLCIAVQVSACRGIIDLLLEASFVDKPLPSSASCRRISPLHAAMSEGNSDLFLHILEKKIQWPLYITEDGGSPLHYAASIGYLEGVRELLRKSTDLALEWDKKGHLPIHLACKMGHVEVVEEFLKQKWPVRDLLTRKGQNILHIAAKYGRGKLVRCLLEKNELEFTKNEQDKNGNTALHLASKSLFPAVLFFLSRDHRVDLNIKNKDDLTAFDIVWMNSNVPMSQRAILSHEILISAGAKQNKTARGREFGQRKLSPSKNWFDGGVKTTILVATLIATVTFAAGVTVPGSVYSSDKPNSEFGGFSVFAHRAMFQVFMICNTIAMYSSTYATLILLLVQFVDERVAQESFLLGLKVVGLALVSMSLAFMAATRLVVSNLSWLANLVTIIAAVAIYYIVLAYVSSLLMFYYLRGGMIESMPRILLQFLVWLGTRDLSRQTRIKKTRTRRN